MWQNPRPGLLPHHFHPLTLHPGTNPSLYRSAVMRVLWSLGGVTLRKEAGGGNPSTRRHGDLVTPPSLTTHRVHHPLGALGLAELCPIAHVDLRWWSHKRDQALQVKEFLSWHILPSSFSLKTVQPRTLSGSGSRDIPPALNTQARGEYNRHHCF